MADIGIAARVWTGAGKARLHCRGLIRLHERPHAVRARAITAATQGAGL